MIKCEIVDVTSTTVAGVTSMRDKINTKLEEISKDGQLNLNDIFVGITEGKLIILYDEKFDNRRN